MNKRLFIILLNSSVRARLTIYLLMVIGMIISNILLMVFGDLYFQSNSKLKEQEFSTNRTSFLFYTKPDFVALSDKIENEIGINNMIFSCKCQSDIGITRIVAYNNLSIFKKSRITSGTIDKEIKRGSFICASEYALRMAEEHNIKIKVGTKISIGKAEFICSGIYLTNDFDILISKEDFAFVDKAAEYSFTYIFNDKVSIKRLNSINKYIDENYNPISIAYPKQTRNFTIWGLLSDLGYNLFLVLIAMINFIFIYVFLIKKRCYAYSILKLCGLTAGKTKCLLLFESEIIFLLSFVISIPLYCFFSPLISGFIFLYSHFIYQLVYSFFILQIFNILIFTIATGRMARKNPIELLRESVVE